MGNPAQTRPTARHDTSITRLLLDWKAGNDTARDRVVPLVYGELRKLAEQKMRYERTGLTIQPTALVHEVYLQLADERGVDWESRSHFFGIATRLMRQVLIQRARARNAEKRGGRMNRVPLDDAGPIADMRIADFADLEEALAELTTEDPRKGRVVELRYFGGMTTEEIAECLSVSKATVEREMRMSLAWLRWRMNPGASVELNPQ